MIKRIKQYILIGILVAAGYFVMNNHFIFYGTDVRFLKKTSMHLHYTFFSVKGKKPATIMEIDYLRDAGIGDLLVEMGVIDDEQRFSLENEYYE
ncbi:MAG: hypothetical protein PVJ41_00715 [Desulfobacterales bacterium]|jgi:hypothetical protein